jgi:NifB/MoaA-like Fe-S oxidoreductase
MRILHTSDWHLGKPLEQINRIEEQREFIHCLSKIVEEEQIDKWQNKLLVEKGSRVVYPADEFYIMADCDIPEYEEYEDFPQLENGVGLVSMLRYEFYEYLSKLKTQSISNGIEWMPNRIVSIATGMCAYRVIKGLAEVLEKRYNNLKVNVYPIENIFFGKHVTVAGLLTGQDIISQLKDKELGQVLMVPETMLKAGENVFLDNCTVDMMEEVLGIKVKVVEISGEAFISQVLGIN